MEATFKIVTNNIDNNSEQINIDNIGISKRYYPLFKNFDMSIQISICEVFKKDNCLFAKCDIIDKMLDLYPAAGLKLISSNVENGITYLNKTQLINISLCDTQNIDLSIKTIREQLNEQ